MTAAPLTGAVALMTGASNGIGAATARRLAHEGAAVAMVDRRRDRLDHLAADISNVGGTSLVLETDITNAELAERAVAMTLDRFARLDILVNNAGIVSLGTALHAMVGDWDRMVELNIQALLYVTHAAVPYLIDAAATSHRQVADIVNVISTAGRVARPGSSVYALTTFGLAGFTESLRQELLVERVRVSVVEPGPVDTEMVDQFSDLTRAFGCQITDVEMLLPEDVADAIAYIVTRKRRVAVNELLVRSAKQRW